MIATRPKRSRPYGTRFPMISYLTNPYSSGKSGKGYRSVTP